VLESANTAAAGAVGASAVKKRREQMVDKTTMQSEKYIGIMVGFFFTSRIGAVTLLQHFLLADWL